MPQTRLEQLLISSTDSFYLQPTHFFPSQPHKHHPLQPKMAKDNVSMLSRPAAAKQLGELLQEQQEPFTLEVYLLERGYLTKSFILEGKFRCRSSNSSSKLFKRSASARLDKTRKVIPNCSKIISDLLSKLVTTTNNSSRLKSTEDKSQNLDNVPEVGRNSQDNGEDRFSSASISTIFNSCSDSDTEYQYDSPQSGHNSTSSSANNLHGGEKIKQVAMDKKFHGRCLEDTKQHSPVSVLEDVQSEDGSPTYKVQQFEIGQEESSAIIKECPFSIPPYKLPIHSTMLYGFLEQKEEFVMPTSCSLYKRNKRVLQQRKQLLFDRVNDVTRTQGRMETNQRQQFQEFLGIDKLGKLLFENLWTWSKQQMDQANTAEWLHFNFRTVGEAWNFFSQQRRGIAMEIGDAIFDDISHEIVMNMLS